MEENKPVFVKGSIPHLKDNIPYLRKFLKKRVSVKGQRLGGIEFTHSFRIREMEVVMGNTIICYIDYWTVGFRNVDSIYSFNPLNMGSPFADKLLHRVLKTHYFKPKFYLEFREYKKR